MLALRTTSLLALAALTATALGAVIPQPRSEEKVCGYGKQGIKSPQSGATLTLDKDSSTTFEVVYCSAQYFKTRSETASVWLSNSQDSTSGQLLVNSVQPDNKDTDAGYYSYRFNATYQAPGGSNTGGDFWLSVYETATGYYNPENFVIAQQPITFKPNPSDK